MQTSNRGLNILLLLSIFHIVTITASNYLVQIPFQFFGMHTTWGAFTFPFIFLATDLTVRIYGSERARKIIFTAMFPALLISYLVSVMFVDGTFQGLASLASFNTFVARIAVASFAAYLVGQILDITVFNRLRQNALWWVAPACSTIAGNLIDTLSFFSLAFAGSSDPFMAAHWMEIALVDYGYKLAISMLFFLPMYGVLLNFLVNRLNVPIQMNSQQAA
ncbi:MULTISPECIES: 7-cyano-7-deazaguanine/7-aminomethyl-7-deazaguanine transporter [Gammaproteobacteria]|uniref:7-cyano-7-deazaguanine/7-aminomethyl-7- deazaguanine transporter n=1 Tax=Gammaproteobacteria TaxID=1236 RepID=UPI001ADB7E11|nr:MULTISPECIES: 7-cyano-7-deazaguanine/7-aminomethyl-7-deazaguanine transporter [Gammaproteobacteria]MBO9483186.1 7-cyano-7-deazaguanine/7-aminomethyl-7-deazaguanine transporter [Salinisphaera sp. G21_0]MBO9495308.1 7-cyano-7-deazaguanine/7-aminomethyl-7-deazaguanine transporter [Thalassotalea sp. G20_0]